MARSVYKITAEHKTSGRPYIIQIQANSIAEARNKFKASYYREYKIIAVVKLI